MVSVDRNFFYKFKNCFPLLKRGRQFPNPTCVCRSSSNLVKPTSNIQHPRQICHRLPHQICHRSSRRRHQRNLSPASQLSSSASEKTLPAPLNPGVPRTIALTSTSSDKGLSCKVLILLILQAASILAFGIRVVDSGFGWDDNLKMITCDQKTYDEAAHPKCEQFLNKKLDMYDEMALMVGKDMATGSFAKTFADIDLDNVHETDSFPADFETEFNGQVREKTSSSIGTSQPRSHRKRKNILASDNDDEKLDNMAEKLGEIATAIKNFTANQVSTEHLYEEVMLMEGFDEESLVAAFDYLVEHEKQAKAFMVKNKNLKRLWLDKFFRNVT